MKHALPLSLFATLVSSPAFAQDLHWQESGYDWSGAVDLSVDLNGDGLADAIIGDQVGGPGGVVTVRSGVDGALVFTLYGGGGAGVGREVVGMPDLNGNGFAEWGYSDSSGTVKVRDGATGLLLGSYTLLGTETRLAAIGDVNGDGWADLVTSSPDVGPGSVRVVSGRYLADGTQPIFLWTKNGAYTGGHFGEAITSISDVNGDGIDDIVAGAPEESGVSGLFLFFGRIHCLSGATGASIWVKTNFAQSSARYGGAVAAAGDVNGDGIEDVVAGAPWNDANALDAGAAYVISGVNGGYIAQLYHDVQGDMLGSGVAGVGDVNQDGTPDLLIGAEGHSSSLGSARLYSGATMSLITEYAGVGFQGQAGTLSGGVDATGDGLPDFLVSSPGGGYGPGRVQLWRAPCNGGHQSYCTTAANSVSGGATLHVIGTTSISMNAMTLEARHCPPQQPGVFYYGSTQVQVPFGDGYRCAGGDIYRLDPPVFVDQGGFATLTVDFGSVPLGSGPGTVMPGDTRYFQYWYRDPFGPGGSGFNLTNGQVITFCP